MPRLAAGACLSLICGLLVLLGPGAQPSFALTDGCFNYTVSGGNATITGGTGCPTALTIPSTVGSSPSYPVTAIGTYAFGNQGIVSVTIPASVVTIGDRAFKQECGTVGGCGSSASSSSLTSLTFEAGGTAPLTIGSEAFRINALSSLTLPDRVTTIGPQAFDQVWSNTRSLATVTLGRGVTSIGDQAFQAAPMTDVVFRGNKPALSGSPFKDTGSAAWRYWGSSTGWVPNETMGGHEMVPIVPPTVTGISPTFGPVAGGTTVTITGTTFTAGDTVTVGGAVCTDVVVADAGSLSCTTGAGTAGTGLAVSVTAPEPQPQTGTLSDALPTSTLRPQPLGRPLPPVAANSSCTGPILRRT